MNALQRLYSLFVVCGMVFLAGCGTALPRVQAEPPVPVPVVREGQPWTFVVFGDTRDNTKSTPTGISGQLRRMVEAIVAEKPALVLHVGDLVNGYYTDEASPVHGKYIEQFDHWRTAVRPMYDFETGEGIPLYVVRGNHEDGELVTNGPLKEAFREMIGRYMPQNGPEKEKGLTYSIAYRKAAFIALDEYSMKEFGVLRGLIDQPWVDAELARLSRYRHPFLFVFGHQPAYKVSAWKKGPFPDLYAFPEHRDAFWKSLETAGAGMYFCGHVHFYARVAMGNVQQVLIGNGGAETVDFDPAEVDPSVTREFPQGKVKRGEIKPGYVVFTVDESAGTVTAVQKLWDEQKQAWVAEGDAFSLPTLMSGADRDAHGCIGSAGYLWCERESACVRPWELASEKRIKSDERSFQDYCRSGPR